jgi:hypothetical protein
MVAAGRASELNSTARMALLPTLGSDARADSKADCDWADGLGLFIVCRDRVRERESPADRQTARSWLHCLCTASALGQATQAGRQAGRQALPSPRCYYRGSSSSSNSMRAASRRRSGMRRRDGGGGGGMAGWLTGSGSSFVGRQHGWSLVWPLPTGLPTRHWLRTDTQHASAS